MEFSGLSVDIVLNTLGQLVPLLIGVILGIVVLEVALYQFLTKVVKSKHALPYTLLAPAIIALVVFMIYPLVFNVALAFSDLKRSTFPCYSPVAIGECELDHTYGVDYAVKTSPTCSSGSVMAKLSVGDACSAPLIRRFRSCLPARFSGRSRM
ncbi:MAG: sugar ABC transporter permease [Chloroflexi bacterium]|nr:sugar ABC transporter permease [Chloroflexota bacterium]